MTITGSSTAFRLAPTFQGLPDKVHTEIFSRLSTPEQLASGQLNKSFSKKCDESYKQLLSSEHDIKWENLKKKYTKDRLLSPTDIYLRQQHFAKQQVKDKFHGSEELLFVRSLDSTTLTDGEVLNDAAWVGNLHLVKWLIEEEGLEPSQNTLLRATYAGNIALIDYLVEEKKISPTKEMLNAAASKGNMGLVHYFVEKKGIQPKEAATLNRAAQGGNIDVFSYLIGKGLQPKEAALSMAAKDSSVTFMRYLIDEQGLKPTENTLKSAVQGDNIPVIRYLLEEKNLPLGEEFLYQKIWPGNAKALRYLIEEKGVQPTITSLNEAANQGNVEFMRYLITEKNLQPTELTLYFAQQASNTASVKFLLKEYQLKDIRDESIQNALQRALVRADLDDMPWLLEQLEKQKVKPSQEFLNDNIIQSGNKLDLTKWLIKKKHLKPTDKLLKRSIGANRLQVALILIDARQQKSSDAQMVRTHFKELGRSTEQWLAKLEAGHIPDLAQLRA